MRASTLAVATLSVLAAQGINQTATAADAPANLEPGSDAEQLALSDRTPVLPTPTATGPEPEAQPQFAMTRVEVMVRSEVTAPDATSDLTAGEVPAVAAKPIEPVGIPIPVIGPDRQPTLVSQQVIPVPQPPTIPSAQLIGPDNTSIPVVQLEDQSEPNPDATPEPEPTPQVDVSRPTYVSYGPSGVSSRRLRTSQLNFVSVTNSAGTTVEIELVGQTRPLVLLPGQTRRFAVRTTDLSLLYWVPTSPTRRDIRLAGRVNQTAGNAISVNLVRSQFPSDNLAIYFAEPNSPDYTLKVF